MNIHPWTSTTSSSSSSLSSSLSSALSSSSTPPDGHNRKILQRLDLRKQNVIAVNNLNPIPAAVHGGGGIRQKHDVLLHDFSDGKGSKNKTRSPATQQQQQRHKQKPQQQQRRQRQEIDNSYVDGLLSSKLTQMSLQERSNGLYDIHGISQVQETSEMIQNGIDDMNQKLLAAVSEEMKQEKKSNSSRGDGVGGGADDSNSNIAPGASTRTTTRHLPAFHYRLAMIKSPNYVEQLKVSFLRAEEYNGSKAAMRMIRFFQLKAELFGEDALVRDLEFERDLEKEGQDAMYRGAIQILSQRDRAGRPILFAYGRENSSRYSTESIIRCLFYVTMCAAFQDIESQKRGVIILSYALGQVETVPGRASAIAQCLQSVPIRISAYHLCMNTSALSIPAYLLCSYLENRNICRFKVHTGTPMECVYNLMTFGIPKEVIPVDVGNGSVDLTSHHAMLGALKRVEQLRRELSLMGATTSIQDFDTSGGSEGSSFKDQSGFDGLHAKMIQGGTEGDAAASNVQTSSISSNVQCCRDDTTSGTMTRQSTTKDLEVKKPKMSMATPPKQTAANNKKMHTTTTAGKITTTIRRRDSSSSGGSMATTTSEKGLILVPGPMDIIPGKGRKPKRHPGGLRLHGLVLKYQEEYDTSTKSEKAILMDVVLKEMKMAGCRFLMVAPDFVDTSSSTSTTSGDKNNNHHHQGDNNKDVYVECDDILARSKISHAFRNLRSKTKRQGGPRDQDIDDHNVDNYNNNNNNSNINEKANVKETTTAATFPSSGGGSKKHADSTIDKDCDLESTTGVKKRLRTEERK